MVLCKTYVFCYVIRMYTFDSRVINEEIILNSDQHRHNNIPYNDSDVNDLTI